MGLLWDYADVQGLGVRGRVVLATPGASAPARGALHQAST